MKRKCPLCGAHITLCSRFGFFVRKSDRRRIQRYKCKICGKIFSQSTHQLCYWQKKRRLNPRIFELLCSGVSQRRIAFLFKISRTTVARRLLFLAQFCHGQNLKHLKRFGPLLDIQFDDLETFEHTKCKPVSVTMAVDKKTRTILSFAASQMSAKGHLSKIALRKYGPRADLRLEGWNQLFSQIAPQIVPVATIRSDENPHYRKLIERWCPQAVHKTHKGRRGCIVGQGELKKVGYDPLFTLNHTFAMFRGNINRLIRKTWCTTKKIDRLRAHIELYTYFHNHRLIV